MKLLPDERVKVIHPVKKERHQESVKRDSYFQPTICTQGALDPRSESTCQRTAKGETSHEGSENRADGECRCPKH